jgi:hypothetical protein
MKIGILITHLSEAIIIDSIKWNHDFIIYRNQIDQYAVQTTKEHFTWVVEQWYNWLIEQGAECVFATPATEMVLLWREKIIPLFVPYIHQSVPKSMTWKMWFVWDSVTSELVHQIRPSLSKTLAISERQKKHRNFNSDRPIWFEQTHHWATWLDDYSPRSWMINNLIKFDLHQLKDAWVDTLLLTDWSYLLVHKSLEHHTKQMKYQARKIINDTIVWLNLPEWNMREWTFSINWNQNLIHKPKWKYWCKINNISIKERML